MTLVSWQTTLSQQKLVDCNTVLYGSYFAFAGITNTVLCPVRPFRHNLTSNSTAATAISSRFVFDFPRDRDIIDGAIVATAHHQAMDSAAALLYDDGSPVFVPMAPPPSSTSRTRSLRIFTSPQGQAALVKAQHAAAHRIRPVLFQRSFRFYNQTSLSGCCLSG